MAGTFFHAVSRFLREEDGPAAVEYAVILMLILLGVITAVQAVGNANSANLQDSSDQLQGVLGQ